LENETGVETLLDLDAILDQSMDDVEEAVGFITPSEGIYLLAIPFCKIEKYKTKENPNVDKSRIKLGYSVIKQLEKSKSEDPESPPNGLFTEVFQFNSQGLGFFKAKAIDLLTTTDGLSVREAIKAINESALVVKAKVGIKLTPKKEGAGGTGKDYINVQVKVLELVTDIPFPEIGKKVEA
jgi:hypothetical protein